MTRLLLPVIVIAAVIGLYMAGQIAISAGIAALIVIVWIFRQAIRSTRRSR